jgi:hypothetical protein
LSGLGISEFNPEVKKELQALRVENEELKQLVNDSAVESLDRLRQQISDQQCFNSSIQEKWNHSKDIIQQLQRSLTETTQQLHSSQHSYQILSLESEEMSRIVQEDRLSTIYSFQCKEKYMKQSFSDQLKLFSFGQKSIQNILQNELQKLSTELLVLTQNYEEMSENYLTSQKMIHDHEEEIESWGKKYLALEERMKNDLLVLEQENKEKIQRYLESHREEISALSNNYSEDIRVEKRRIESLETDMEIERGKRRKTEREKKLYENEALKYRNQYELLSSGSMSGSEMNAKEMNSVLKEMKLMQDQLDSSREEVKRLQDQISFIQSTGRGTTSSSASSSASLPGSRINASTPLTPALTSEENEQQEVEVPQQGIHSGATRRPQRILVQSSSTSSTHHSSSSSSNGGSYRPNTTTDLSAYIEQTELLERKIELMNRERRELIAKNIEENKERVELNQRLLQHEQEYALLKGKFVKLELEKERLDRRIAKSGETENVPPARGTRIVLGSL